MKNQGSNKELTTKALKAGQGCVCFNVRKTARTLTQIYDDALKPSGLRVTQFTLLMATTLHEPATLNRLASITVTDRTTLTRNLQPLVTQGLIHIESGADRRERQVTMTARGRQVLATAIPLWENLQARFAETFGPERLQQLFGDLSELRAVSRGL